MQYNPSGTISASITHFGILIPFKFPVRGANLHLVIPGVVTGMPRKPLKPAKEKNLSTVGSQLFCFLCAEAHKTAEPCWFNDIIEKPKIDNKVVPNNVNTDTEEKSDYESILAY